MGQYEFMTKMLNCLNDVNNIETSDTGRDLCRTLAVAKQLLVFEQEEDADAYQAICTILPLMRKMVKGGLNIYHNAWNEVNDTYDEVYAEAYSAAYDDESCDPFEHDRACWAAEDAVSAVMDGFNYFDDEELVQDNYRECVVLEALRIILEQQSTVKNAVQFLENIHINIEDRQYWNTYCDIFAQVTKAILS